MAKQIQIRGTIVDNDSADIMRYFGWNDVVCPLDISNSLAEADGDDIELIINSEGGMLISGIEMYCILKAYTGKVNARIQSCAASSATVLMMAADEITSEPVSLLCIHNPSSYVSGDEHDLEHEVEQLKNIKESIINAYDGRLKMTRDEISALMDRDIWISADQALEYGIIDRIEGKKGEQNLLVASGTHMFPTPEMREKYSNSRRSDSYLADKKQNEEIEIERFKLLLNT